MNKMKDALTKAEIKFAAMPEGSMLVVPFSTNHYSPLTILIAVEDTALGGKALLRASLGDGFKGMAEWMVKYHYSYSYALFATDEDEKPQVQAYLAGSWMDPITVRLTIAAMTSAADKFAEERKKH